MEFELPKHMLEHGCRIATEEEYEKMCEIDPDFCILDQEDCEE